MSAQTSTDNQPGANSSSSSSSSSNLLVSLKHKLTKDVDLILASQSPRRREILDMMGITGLYSATPSPLDESSLQASLKADNTPEDYTRNLAEKKAEALAVTLDTKSMTRPTFVLGSDTIVELNGRILEKPTDEEAAFAMLSSLSEAQHKVHTGVALYLVQERNNDSNDTTDGNDSPTNTVVSLVSSFTETAHVTFCPLSDDTIRAYIATKEPMDKAGAYGIQGVGGQFVESIQGDFFAVMGLPMYLVSKTLAGAIQEISSS